MRAFINIVVTSVFTGVSRGVKGARATRGSREVSFFFSVSIKEKRQESLSGIYIHIFL